LPQKVKPSLSTQGSPLPIAHATVGQNGPRPKPITQDQDITDEAISLYHVIAIDGLMLSILVFYLGMYLTRKIAFLPDHYIPPAVPGGRARSWS
jgi:hypothetical protein